MQVQTKKRRQGEVKHLYAAQLEATLDAAILSQDSPELAVIYLTDHYEFDLDALKAKLVGMQCESASLHGIF
jgi:hypothetical protein